MQSAYNFTKGLFASTRVDPIHIRYMKFQDKKLLLATQTSIQIWCVNESHYRCIFLKMIPDVCILELFNDMLLYVTFEQKTQINFFSLNDDRTTHVHLTPSPIRKISTNKSDIAILQLDSTLEILDSKFEHLARFKTFQVNRELFADQKDA